MIEKKIERFLSSYLEKKKIKNTNWSITKNVKKGFGDYSSNIALVLGKISKTSPINIANEVLDHNKDKTLFSVFITEPGFVNFNVELDYYINNLSDIEKILFYEYFQSIKKNLENLPVKHNQLM